MTTEHTPGPWMIHERTMVTDDQARRIADTSTRFRHIDEETANARLIAAAPELFAACESVAAHCEDDWLPPTGDGAYEALNQLRMALRNSVLPAMNKAKGESA